MDRFGTSHITTASNLARDEMVEAVQKRVLDHLGIRGDNNVVQDIPDEIYEYDPEGEWIISSESTEMQDGHAVMEVHLRQPLNGIEIAGVASHLHHPDQMLDEALSFTPTSSACPGRWPSSQACRCRTS